MFRTMSQVNWRQEYRKAQLTGMEFGALKVFEVLRDCVGPQRAISKQELGVASGLGERKAREIVTVLITEYRIPVCSSTDAEAGGYFLPRTAEEAIDAIRHLENRAIALHKRVSKHKQAVLDRFGDQTSLFETAGGSN